MSTFTLVGQNVNGDPLLTGQNINIINGSFSTMLFNDVDDMLGITLPGEQVSLDGGTTWLNYVFLGFGNVRGDPNQYAGFIRVELDLLNTLTIAIDMNRDGDKQANLQNGNTGLKVIDLDMTKFESFPPPPCFVTGTLILTTRGLRPVETIAVGDMVETLDYGPQPVLWTGSGDFLGHGDFAPVRLAPAALGNREALTVSPQHRLLVRGWKAEMFYGEPEVLVPAKHLVNGVDVVIAPRPTVRYHHLLLPRHALIASNGVWSESLFPGDTILAEYPRLAREIRRAAALLHPQPRTARPALRREGRLLRAS